MSEDPARTPAFFGSAARELVTQLIGKSKEDIEAAVAVALADTFESGMASTLLGVVTAVEAVHVPMTGMVVFKVPDGMPERQVAVLRRDLGRISEMLETRVGHKPILLALPEAIAIQALNFEGPDAPLAVEREDAQVIPFPGAPTVGAPMRRIVALDPLKLRDRIGDALAELADGIGPATVLPMGSAVRDGLMHHEVRVVLPKDDALVVGEGTELRICPDIVSMLEDLFLAFALETHAFYEVTVILEGDVAHENSPRFKAPEPEAVVTPGASG